MISNRRIFLENMGLPSSRPMGIEISDAEGIYLYSPEGKKYIDLVSGVAVSNLGHKNPEIIRAVQEQAGKYMHLMVYGEYIQSPQVELAKMLSEVLPASLSMTYFVNSGSEAIEGAMKLAKRFTGRSGIIAFKNAYHGGTQGALSILGNEKLKNAFRPLLPGISHLAFNNFEDLDQITEDTACVVAETIQAEAGIILPEQGFLKALREKCNQTGTLLVLDDIQMGMGRTGKLFSFEHFGIIPDILALAKAFGGGMPLGAFISSPEIMSSLTHHPELGHITTFGGHPVSCAAGLANLHILTRDHIFYEADKKGKMFFDFLSGHSEIKQIRYKGLMMGLDVESPEKREKLLSLFIEKGILVDPFLFNPISFRIGPPLIISEEEIQKSCEIILSCLDNI